MKGKRISKRISAIVLEDGSYWDDFDENDVDYEAEEEWQDDEVEAVGDYSEPEAAGVAAESPSAHIAVGRESAPALDAPVGRADAWYTNGYASASDCRGFRLMTLRRIDCASVIDTPPRPVEACLSVEAFPEAGPQLASHGGQEGQTSDRASRPKTTGLGTQEAVDILNDAVAGSDVLSWCQACFLCARSVDRTPASYRCSERSLTDGVSWPKEESYSQSSSDRVSRPMG